MANEPVKPVVEFELSELAELLIKQQDLHEGLFDLSFQFQVHVGMMGPSPEQLYPGSSTIVQRIGLVPARQRSPHTVDAAEVNPAPVD